MEDEDIIKKLHGAETWEANSPSAGHEIRLHLRNQVLNCVPSQKNKANAPINYF
jgi:hypothetical protein